MMHNEQRPDAATVKPQQRRCPCRLIRAGLLGLLLFSLVWASMTLAAPAAISLSITADAAQVKEGDLVTYNYNLANTSAQTDVIFYASIPAGLTFLAVDGAMPQTYTIGMRATDEIRSIAWAGPLNGTHLITLSTIVGGPGEGPGGDIEVDGMILSTLSGITIYSTTHLIDYRWSNELYLPLITRSGSPPVASPTPTATPITTPPLSGTPTPWPDRLEIDGVMMTFRRQAELYEDALNTDDPGPGGVVGSEYYIWDDYLEVGQWGVDDRPYGFRISYHIRRGFLEFDTAQIHTQPTTVTLQVQIGHKPIGLILPQTIHRGTWTGRLRDDQDFSLRWKDFEAAELARYLETNSTAQTLDLAIPLPVSTIILGDITHLVIRSDEEGTPPPSAIMTTVLNANDSLNIPTLSSFWNGKAA